MSIELTRGQVAWEKSHGLYQVMGGLGAGKVVRLYQCSSQTEAKCVVNFINAMRTYPDEAEVFSRWLRGYKGQPRTIAELPVRDYEYESITQASTTSDNGAETLAVNREEVAHGNPGDS